MKTLYQSITAILFSSLIFTSCEDFEKVEEPNFKITVNQETLKAGEPVIFDIENTPQFLTYFSGAPGQEYQYRDRTLAEGNAKISFKTAQHWGNGSSAQNTMSVWISEDYNQGGTAEDIAAANWTDITDRVALSTLRAWTLVDSGVADISDFSNGNPVAVAFKFDAEEHHGTGNRQPIWHVADFNVSFEVANSETVLNVANMDVPGFGIVDVEGYLEDPEQSNWYRNGNKFQFQGGNLALFPNEDWLISKPIYLNRVQPDQSESVKTYATRLNQITHTYEEPGTYTVTFIGKNETIYGSAEKIISMDIEVTE